MKSFLEIDDLNLGGHRRIAVHTSGETNQYSSTARFVAGVKGSERVEAVQA